MSAVKVSPKYQVVIPRDVRKSLRIKPGQKYQVIAIGDCIELVPIVPLRKLRGFAKGIDTTIHREADRI